jgi:cyclophilin family peptidyl-prolyl cis-trans isomerase
VSAKLIESIKRSFIRHHRARRSRYQAATRLEQFEQRLLLAGDVALTQIGSNFHLYGDDLDNSVEIVVENGDTILRGLAGTTINGGSDPVTLAAGTSQLSGSMFVSLRNGDDLFEVGTGVQVAGSLFVWGGRGNDDIGLVGTSVGRGLSIDTGTGAANISIQQSSIDGNAVLHSAGSPTTVSLLATSVGNNLIVHTGQADDDVVLDDVSVGNDVFVSTGAGSDDFVIRSSTIGDDVTYVGGRGDDFFVVDSSMLQDHVWLYMGHGHDNIMMRGTTSVQDRVWGFGGKGSDLVEFEPTINVKSLKRHSVTGLLVTDALVDARIDNAETGAYAAAMQANAIFVPMISLALGSSSVSEADGEAATTLTVTRTGRTDEDLLVTLTSSNTDKALVPATVTIPSGQQSATVDVAAVDNNLLDDDAVVTITGVASGMEDATTELTVTNDDGPFLTLSVSPAAVAEDAGADTVELTVTRTDRDVSQELVVDLSSANTNRLVLPATVTFAAGETSTVVFASPVDNEWDDGNADVAVTAAANGFDSASELVRVNDDDPAALTAAVVPSSVAEDATTGTVLTISRNTVDTSGDVVVTISISDTSQLTGPGTATIPAGEMSVDVVLTPVNDNVLEDDLSVTVDLTATGFVGASVDVEIIDDDTPTLVVTPSVTSIAETAGDDALTVTISRQKIVNEDETVNLTYSDPQISGPATAVISAGELSVVVSLSVTDDEIPDGDNVVTIVASSSISESGSNDVVVTDDEQLMVTAAATGQNLVQSNGTVITQDELLTINGSSFPGATIAWDADNDGEFDDGTTTADQNGDFSFETTLTHNDVNNGGNVIPVQATLGQAAATAEVSAHLAVGSVIRFVTAAGLLDVELLNQEAPITVANFLQYLNSNAFDNLLVQRNVSNFVVQAGAFTVNGSELPRVTKLPPIVNEFDGANSNLRGTLSMALPSGNPNGGTSEFFFNVVNNVQLDSRLHTVFGRVVGDGMDVVDDINQLTPFDLSTLYDDGSLQEVPLTSFAATGTQLTGTVSLFDGSDTLTGAGTLFTSELAVGDGIEIADRLYFVSSIESDTSLKLTLASTVTVSDQTATTNVTPTPDEFVVFTAIDEILSAL